MSNSQHTPGVASGRLPDERYASNFADLHDPFTSHEAAVAADRCYFCYDAPCVDACPTAIDIPLFIRQISTGSAMAAAKTIFDSNILGGMCARVCPTETLCEEACVREAAEGKPVEIGRLQRFATDLSMASGTHPYSRAEATGKRVAVVGAGPAGLACAHRLAMKGHEVSLFDPKDKAGGLNEYGIAAYKVVGQFASREIDWLLEIGGITLNLGAAPLTSERLQELRSEFDAVFLGIGLAGVNSLAVEGAGLENVEDAVEFIAGVRQSRDLSEVAVGRNVVVIGGGMTAIDAAMQSRLLGADTVTIAYRNNKERMSASGFEQELATSNGIRIVTNARPKRLLGDGKVQSIELERTESGEEGLRDTGETIQLPADQVFIAIGQRLEGDIGVLEITGGKIRVSSTGRTGLDGVWAGGDCAAGGDDLTVTAVAEGRDAAEDIHRVLSGK